MGFFLDVFFEAYVQVTSFVAITLWAFYRLDRAFAFSSRVLQRYGSTKVMVSAFLGAIPGCGGAIAVVTQYSTGQLCFACLVAGLTATMGDAAFLLLAKEPMTALGVIGVCLCIGGAWGLLVNYLHPDRYLTEYTVESMSCAKSKRKCYALWIKSLWYGMLIANFPATFLIALQFQMDEFGIAGRAMQLLGAISIGWILLLEGMRKFRPTWCFVNQEGSLYDKTMHTTNFVTVWVAAGYVVFEGLLLWMGFDVDGYFSNIGVWTPLLACLVGLLPSCGPQVLVASLYLKKAIPLSALVANALSNDGDALFPAIAVSPRAALVATLYGLVPALLVGYGMYGFLHL